VTPTGLESCLSKLSYYHLILTVITHSNERFGQPLFNAMFDQLSCTAFSPTAAITSERNHGAEKSSNYL
ncbi:hypothetical protein SMA66_24905, partial [Escherichia coli]|uniref:hypothetical protein n=1 Tax=Escherichia coli TaxID=562 RepID=UPI00307A3C60